MTHDPMCHSLTEAEGLDVYYNGPVGGSDHIECITCYYIAKIRADEQKRVLAAGPYFTSVVHECCVKLQEMNAKPLPFFPPPQPTAPPGRQKFGGG